MDRYEIVDTGWGAFAYVLSSRGLSGTFLPQRSRADAETTARIRWPDATRSRGLCPELGRRLIDYFRGVRVTFDEPLDLSGFTDFRRSVLEACRRVPYGCTASYADLARAAGSPRASRAASSTMANNPLPLIVPCHRIISSDGSLGGYSAAEGLDLKLRLLQLEGAQTPRMNIQARRRIA